MNRPERHGSTASGWCLTRDHDHCRYAACGCECGHTNRVAAQANTRPKE